jgi:hypothetical protein
MVIMVNLETLAHLVLQGYLDHLAHKDHLVKLDPLDHLVHREKQESMEPKEHGDLKGTVACLDNVDQLDSLEEMEHLAHKDHPVSTAHLVRTEMWAPLDPMDHQATLDLRVLLEKRESLVPLDPMAHLDNLASKD